MTAAPTLHTDRLTLRHHRLEDFEPMATHFATDWAQYMGGPLGQEKMWLWLAAEVGSWSLLGHGSWAGDLTATGETIGQVGINKPVHFPEVEIGWLLYPGFEGHGYAFEAATAARAWAFENGHDTLVSYIDPPNSRSIALAERLGAVLDKDADKPDPDDLVYRHNRRAA